MSPIAQILELLKNGEWHELKGVAEKTQLNESQMGLVMSFLTEYDFIELDAKKKKTRVTSPFFSFLKKIQSIENNTKYHLPISH
jgi:DNA-binding IclR family transcriptional regulator